MEPHNIIHTPIHSIVITRGVVHFTFDGVVTTRVVVIVAQNYVVVAETCVS